MSLLEDLNDPAYVADPYPVWERLRDEAPAHWCTASRFWVVTRYDDVVALLHDPSRFSSSAGPSGYSEEAGLPRLTMIQDDPPHHDRLRRILSKAFTPRITAEREGRLREIAGALVAELRERAASGEAVDLVRDFSSPFPVNVIAEILGIPEDLRDELRIWNATTSVTGAASLRESSTVRVMREMHVTLAELIEARRRERRDDLFSALIDASESDDSPLQPEELVGLCQLLWTAGNETTTNLLSNAALVLQERPDLLAMVRDEPARIPAVVEEMLRLHSPLNGLARVTTTDVELHGQSVRRGDKVMVMFASANRDPRHFEDPTRFEPGRRPNDHVAFGHGIHFCLGSHLARLEARIGLELLGELLPEARLQPEKGARIPFGILRGWLRLPMEIGAGA